MDIFSEDDRCTSSLKIFLEPDDSSFGISKAELEQFWGKEISSLNQRQRRLIIELYKKSLKQKISRQEIESTVMAADSEELSR